jgi:hypothetical protein
VSNWPSWETARLAWEGTRFWLIIAVGSLVGLLGAYGREQHEGRAPDRKWLVGRLCIMPFLAFAAAALSVMMNLSGQVMAFVAALFSLLAYDLVRVIAMRALKRAAGGEIKLPTDAAVEIPAGNGTPEVVKVKTTPGTPLRNELRQAFPAKASHDRALNRLLDDLGEPEL